MHKKQIPVKRSAAKYADRVMLKGNPYIITITRMIAFMITTPAFFKVSRA